MGVVHWQDTNHVTEAAAAMCLHGELAPQSVGRCSQHTAVLTDYGTSDGTKGARKTLLLAGRDQY